MRLLSLSGFFFSSMMVMLVSWFDVRKGEFWLWQRETWGIETSRRVFFVFPGDGSYQGMLGSSSDMKMVQHT